MQPEIQVIPSALNALIGKDIYLILHGDNMFGSFYGELDTVVGCGNYTLRTKVDDVTVRFSAHKIIGISSCEVIPIVNVEVDQQPKLED